MKLLKTLTCTAVAAALSAPLAAATTEIVPAAINDHVQLGTAYNSFANDFLNYQTVTGNIDTNTASNSVVVFDRNVGLTEISSAINGNASLDADFPVIDVNANADIALASAADEYSSTWVLSQVVNGSSKSLSGGSQGFLGLSPEGQTVANLINTQNLPSSQVLERAGSHYVSQINYGASLLVVMKAEYLNQSDRTDVEAAINVNFTAGDASLNGSFVDDRLRQSVRITVRAHQFGGDPLQLSQVIPQNIVQCSLENFAPCESLFENAIAYARGNFVNQISTTLGNSGLTDEQKLDNLNVISYAVSPYDINQAVFQAPSGGYQVSGNNTTAYEQEYEEQLTVYQRATALLGDFQGDQSQLQSEAIRAIGQAALANAGTMQDIVEFCRENPFNNDCINYVNQNCPLQGGEYSCLDEYSEVVLNVGATPLERVQNEHNRLVQNSSYRQMGFDMLSARYTGGLIESHSVNPATGEINMPWAGEAFFTDDFRNGAAHIDYNRVNRSFLITANKRMEVRMGNRSSNPGEFSGSVKIYQNGQWRVVSSTAPGNHFFDSNFERNHVADENNMYYYLVEMDNLVGPFVSMWTTANDTTFTIHTKDVKSLPNGDGLNRDNIPFYFTDKNINVAKDVNGQDIGWCVRDSGGLQRGNTNDCYDKGRRYTWEEAFRACEAYNEVSQADGGSGLVWSLPSKKDYDDFIATIGQTTIAGISGAGRQGRYLKSWQFEEYTGFNDFIGTNTLGFNFEPTGFFVYPHNFSTDTPTAPARQSWSWTSTEGSSSHAYSMGLRHNRNDVLMLTRDKRDLRTVRCIGTYTK